MFKLWWFRKSWQKNSQSSLLDKLPSHQDLLNTLYRKWQVRREAKIYKCHYATQFLGSEVLESSLSTLSANGKSADLLFKISLRSVCVCVCVCIHFHSFMCIYMCTYTHTYIHTHTHIYTHMNEWKGLVVYYVCLLSLEVPYRCPLCQSKHWQILCKVFQPKSILWFQGESRLDIYIYPVYIYISTHTHTPLYWSILKKRKSHTIFWHQPPWKCYPGNRFLRSALPLGGLVRSVFRAHKSKSALVDARMCFHLWRPGSLPHLHSWIFQQTLIRLFYISVLNLRKFKSSNTSWL